MEENPFSWETIVDVLIKDIQSNRYRKDEKLPSENDMAARFCVSRADIRKAYARLKEFGYICSVQGRGSFFCGMREVIPLRMRGGSFSQKMKELGLPYESRNIVAKPIRYNPLIYEQLNAQKGDKVWEIARLRIICHEPAAIHTSYLPEKEFPMLPQDAESITSVFEYFEKTGHAGHKGEGACLSVGTLTSTERKFLDVVGYAPGLTYSARRLAADGKTILEFLRTVYRADRFIFLL